MLPDCPFLEINRKKSWLPRYTCASGVNFYSVGPERELCQTCSIADWGQVLCDHLEVYTILRVNGHGKPSVQVEMECCLPRSALPDQARCAICPEVHPGTLRRAPSVAAVGDAIRK